MGNSTCIVQDDLKMQQTEIMRMGSIYSNALFTIIAAAGDHANSGLPGVEPGSREQVQKILKLGDSELLTIIDFSNSQNGIDDTVWAQRACVGVQSIRSTISYFSLFGIHGLHATRSPRSSFSSSLIHSTGVH